MPVRNTGEQIQVPVGEGTLGRIFNVLGKTIDQRGPLKNTELRPIHAESPTLADQSGEDEVLETGIKVRKKNTNADAGHGTEHGRYDRTRCGVSRIPLQP